MTVSISDVDAAKRVGLAINMMRTSGDDEKRLLAVRDCSRALDPAEHQDAIDHLAAMATDRFDLPVDLVQDALAERPTTSRPQPG
jgi:hypothetical protein